MLRTRLQRLVERIAGEVGDFGHRVFTDSGPVLEVALAALREYVRAHRAGGDDLVAAARADRVLTLMRPYMEALA